MAHRGRLGRRDFSIAWVLRTFNDPVVAFRTGAERVKRLLISLAFVSRQRGVIAFEFDNDSPLLQSSFVGLNLARAASQKVPAE